MLSRFFGGFLNGLDLLVACIQLLLQILPDSIACMSLQHVLALAGRYKTVILQPCCWSVTTNLFFHYAFCVELTMAGCQVPTTAALSLLSTAEQGRENMTEGSWIEIKTGRVITHQFLSQAEQTQLGDICWIYYRSESEQDNEMQNKS